MRQSKSDSALKYKVTVLQSTSNYEGTTKETPKETSGREEKAAVSIQDLEWEVSRLSTLKKEATAKCLPMEYQRLTAQLQKVQRELNLARGVEVTAALKARNTQAVSARLS